MYIKNLKILVLISFGFLIIALGMYFDGKNISNKSSSEVLFPSFDEVLPEIAYIEFSNQNENQSLKSLIINGLFQAQIIFQQILSF